MIVRTRALDKIRHRPTLPSAIQRTEPSALAGLTSLFGKEKAVKQESRSSTDERLLDKIWHRPTLPHFTAVPSALAGLTSLFGMGRGGHRRYRHLNIFGSLVHLFISSLVA